MQRLKQTALLAFITCIAAIPQKSYAQSTPLPAGAISAHVLGRVQILPDFSVKVYGYFTFVTGAPSSIFNGAPSENTAVLTFAADPTAATLISNGGVIQGLENPVNGSFTAMSLYYNSNPAGRNILNPDDFTQGQKVATFRSRAAVVNITSSGNFQGTSGLALDTADTFVVNGQPLNIGSLISALNLTVFGPAPTLDSVAASLLTDGSVSIPFSGTAYVAPPLN